MKTETKVDKAARDLFFTFINKRTLVKDAEALYQEIKNRLTKLAEDILKNGAVPVTGAAKPEESESVGESYKSPLDEEEEIFVESEIPKIDEDSPL